MSMPSMAPQDAGTVQVRVQVIDMEPFALDLILPTYIPSKDLTQRVARDAGLGAYWEDGTRRLFWIRARGRLMGEDERLQDLGIVPNELIHLLPQPPQNSGVMERPPEYPKNKGYAGAGWLNVAGGMTLLLAWSGVWSVALLNRPGILMGMLPALGLSLLAVSFSRHLWGGEAAAVRVPLTAFVVFLSLMVLAVVPSIASGVEQLLLAWSMGLAFVTGLLGLVLGWLAWYGPVEPLPKGPTAAERVAAAAQVAETWPCGVCGQPVTAEVRADCMYQCGRVFHSGCYRAQQGLSRQAGCAICGYRPA